MRLAHQSKIKGEGLSIWIIVLFILAGAGWFLYSSRGDSVREAHAFANEVSKKIVVDCDDRYLLAHLNPENQAAHLPAWRERLFRSLRSFGPMTKPMEVTGDVFFTSYFFEPRGTFKTEMSYATMPAHLDLSIAKGMNGWRIDEINLVWNPPPAPSPTPAAAMTPTPSPSPSPTPQQKQKRKRG
jgi:hypothetical protein